MIAKTFKGLMALSCLVGLNLVQTGCQSESISGSNSQDLLSTNLALRAEMDYMRQLARNGDGRVVLDLADDTQYRFLQGRLQASGKTLERFPQFYSMLKAIREKHLARKQNPHLQSSANPPGSFDHLVGDFTISPDGTRFEATAFSTVEDGADYSFVDAVVWNSSYTQQISDYGWGESYGDGRKLRALAVGPLPFTSDGYFQIDSVSLISRGGSEEALYISETVRTPPGGYIFHPRDNSGDNIVTICLNRGGTEDCDYPLVGKMEVQIPLKGAVTFPFPVKKINNNNKTYVKLVEEHGGPREMKFGPFFNRLKINPADRRQVTWDVPQSQGVFNGIRFQAYEDVDFFLSMDVELERPGAGGLAAATSKISSLKTSTSPGMPVVRKLQLIYGCLAEGTGIRLADGTTAKVETLTKGSKVLTNDQGLALGVADTSVGVETIPMVRIADDAGHDLLLTVSHPVVTPDHGAVWAETLSVGSKVVTESGITTLVKVQRELYGKHVYNLKLAPNPLAVPEFDKGNALYANGFRVGDMTMQKAFEFKAHGSRQPDVLASLPSRWHMDYQNSQQQGADRH